MNRKIGGLLALIVFALTSTTAIAGARSTVAKAPTAQTACCPTGACCGPTCDTTGCR